MKLKLDEMEMLFINRDLNFYVDVPFHLNGIILSLTDQNWSHRILLDPQLSLDSQIAAIVKDLFVQIYLLYQCDYS